MRPSFSALLLISATLLSTPAWSQSNSAVMERLDRLERDIMMTQRQIARGEGRAVAGADDSASVASDPQTNVRLDALEEEMRKIRGQAEENSFQLKRLNETLERLQQDNDFRFQQLEKTGAAGTAPTAAPPVDNSVSPAAAAMGATPKDTHETAAADAPPAPAGKTTAGDGSLKVPAENPSGDFAEPREHYNHAFKLLNQARYEESARYFQSFISKYPNDPLIGNAYYWLGETFYIKRDYVKAADQFRQGFETLPTGPKAADNLLKLSMSLSALKREKEACVVLDQLLVRFKDGSTSVNEKARSERTRLGCK